MEYISLFFYYLAVAAVFVIMISILVAAHELGHYLFARLFGMGVEEFAIGFGKKPIWTWMRRTYKVSDDQEPGVEKTETTDFTVRPWPLGGFVRIKGMIPEEDGSEVHIPGGFYNKPPLQRFIVLLAGPAFSVIAGILLLIPLYSIVGVERRVNEPIVSSFVEGKPAHKAGIQLGDKFVSIDGKPITKFSEMIFAVRDKAGVPMELVVERNGKLVTLNVTPELQPTDSPIVDENLEPIGRMERQAALGIHLPSKSYFAQVGFARATQIALNEPVRAVRSMVDLLTKPRNFEKTVSGPATMVAFTNFAIQQGFSKIIQLAALLSISVGIFNLLPMSPLDGGQMVVSVVEMFRRGRRLSIQVQSAISTVGMALIFMLVAGAWFFDFKRWFVPKPPDTTKIQQLDPTPAK